MAGITLYPIKTKKRILLGKSVVMSDSHRHQIHGSSVGSNKRDGVEYVRYLLDGSGAENSVDFTMLRRDLESMSTPQVGIITLVG